PDLADAGAALGLERAALAIERQDATHRAAVHRELAGVERGVTVAPPGAAERDLEPLLARGGEHVRQLLHARRAHRARQRADGAAEAVEHAPRGGGAEVGARHLRCRAAGTRATERDGAPWRRAPSGRG